MKRVGILAGTFDPIHNGHIELAMMAAKFCGLDRVFFLPEPRPRRKQGVRALEHRLNMVEIASDSDAILGAIKLNQQRFTVKDTLPVLLAMFEGADLYVVMGDDVLDHIAEWSNIAELFTKTKLAVAVRGSSKTKATQKLKAMQKMTNASISYEIFEIGQTELSSRQVRANIKKHKTSEGLPKEVLEYALINSLYASTAPTQSLAD